MLTGYRTAANMFGIWAKSSDEIVYFFCTREEDGNPLDGSQTYQMHFPAGQHPDAVVESYWSIILVSLPGYRVVPNPDDRFNLISYSPLVTNEDGSLDLYFSPERAEDIIIRNWLPTPRGAMFSLTLRTYGPKDIVKQGQWFSALVKKIK